jgi:hypothetical protein
LPRTGVNIGAIFQALKSTLPSRWFGEVTPVLDSVLGSLATGWSGQFSLLRYTKAQTRIHTAFGSWLDLIAKDYFAFGIRRRLRETDNLFRERICRELLRDRCTREAIRDLLVDLTGRPPIIFEPTFPLDTGSYGSLGPIGIGTAGYCIAGGWGDLNLPFQVFVRVFRSVNAGVAMVNGWGGEIGGFGIGQNAYTDLAMTTFQANDSELCQDICRIAPAGTIVWVSIES